MNGFFSDEDALFFEVELISDEGLELPVDAMLDKGFSYWLALDNQDINQYGSVKENCRLG